MAHCGHVPENIARRWIDTIVVKGKSKAVKIYEVLDGYTDHIQPANLLSTSAPYLLMKQPALNNASERSSLSEHRGGNLSERRRPIEYTIRR